MMQSQLVLFSEAPSVIGKKTTSFDLMRPLMDLFFYLILFFYVKVVCVCVVANVKHPCTHFVVDFLRIVVTIKGPSENLNGPAL